MRQNKIVLMEYDFFINPSSCFINRSNIRDSDMLLNKIKSAESNDMSFLLNKKQKKSKKNFFEVTETNLDEDSFTREFENEKSIKKFTTDLRNITLHDPSNFLQVEEDELNATAVGQTGDIDIDNAEQIQLVMELFNIVSLIYHLK